MKRMMQRTCFLVGSVMHCGILHLVRLTVLAVVLQSGRHEGGVEWGFVQPRHCLDLLPTLGSNGKQYVPSNLTTTL
jgi:hypothetical protein